MRAGVVPAHAMFAEPLIALSSRLRSGAAQGLSEGVATFGLLFVISRMRELARNQPRADCEPAGACPLRPCAGDFRQVLAERIRAASVRWPRG